MYTVAYRGTGSLSGAIIKHETTQAERILALDPGCMKFYDVETGEYFDLVAVAIETPQAAWVPLECKQKNHICHRCADRKKNAAEKQTAADLQVVNGLTRSF
jgi:hypothetical protein